jgi:hypothetical protein
LYSVDGKPHGIARQRRNRETSICLCSRTDKVDIGRRERELRRNDAVLDANVERTQPRIVRADNAVREKETGGKRDEEDGTRLSPGLS